MPQQTELHEEGGAARKASSASQASTGSSHHCLKSIPMTRTPPLAQFEGFLADLQGGILTMPPRPFFDYVPIAQN